MEKEAKDVEEKHKNQQENHIDGDQELSLSDKLNDSKKQQEL